MRCLIVDDEILAIKLLSDYVQKIPELELIATSQSALEARSILQRQQQKGEPIRLLFLDIQMPDLTGLELMANLSEPLPYIILTTAYSN